MTKIVSMICQLNVLALFVFAIGGALHDADNSECIRNGYDSVSYASYLPYDATCIRRDNGDVLETKLSSLYK